MNELSRRAAEAVVRTINDTARATGRCSLVLSGGNTPRTLHGLLASEFRDQIPWARVHVFWGDERYVSPDDPDSNYRMARETLLDHVPCPAGNVHPMPTHFPSPADAARDYERTAEELFWKRFVAFRPDPARPRRRRTYGFSIPGIASAWRADTVGRRRGHAGRSPLRLTLTLPALTRAANIYVLVAGSKKANALHHVLTEVPDPNTYPAAGVRSTEGTLIWWVDREASSLSARVTH